MSKTAQVWEEWLATPDGARFAKSFPAPQSIWDKHRKHRVVFARSSPRRRPSKAPHVVGSGRI
jgi:hypothetical protein